MNDWATLVRCTASLSGVAEQLLRDHQSDQWGRCKGCSLPQTGPKIWPCTLYRLGVDAHFMVTGTRVA